MIELKVPGLPIEGAERAETELGLGETVKTAVRVAAPARGGEAVTIKAEDDDVIELQLDGGGVLWLRADELEERLGPTAARSGADGPLVLGDSLPLDDASRGVGAWTIKALRVLGIDLGEKTAVAIAERFDAKAVPAPGLFRWDGKERLQPFEHDEDAAGEPWLVFIHGTASSTQGSFGDLAREQPETWQQIEKHYRRRILAFEHHTLTASPIGNARDLVGALPTGAELHVVSHSRGGLVGELLGRGQLTDSSGNARGAFDEVELGLFSDEAYQAQHAELLELGEALAEKRLRVTRFVRVACPARGTSLLGGKVDRWLNLFFNVFGWVAGGRLNPVASELLDALGALVKAVVKERTDPETLPGLAAMAPDFSPLLVILNRQDARLQDRLCVVAGDTEPTALSQRLALWFADLFFGTDHDLVVDTVSMDGGTPRTELPVVFRQQAPQVNHFSYFANPRSAAFLAHSLLDDEPPRDLGLELSRAATERMPKLVSRGTDKVPTAFVLPGISGSHLKIGNDRIWIDLSSLAFGGVGKLAIENSRVEPDELVARYYADLCEELSATHDVKPWAYDWRRSIIETAERLARDLHSALDANDSALRIVAHSMGGLVARAALAVDEDLWQRFKDRSGSRLVMLGTPNGGSFSIPMLLLGRNRMMRYLAALDLRANASEHLEVVAGWPGALQLLPHSEAELFTVKGWDSLPTDDAEIAWHAPPSKALAEARRFRDLLKQAPLDAERMLYVAGQGLTYAGMSTSGNDKTSEITFQQSFEGDGQVLWSTGIPQGLNTWYARVAHGDLARDRAVVSAVLDLVEGGTTSRLQKHPPPLPRGRGTLPSVAREPLQQVPSEDQLLATAMGGAPWSVPKSRIERPVSVRVVNGHLKLASHPVLVGHYVGDSLNGTELALDREQNRRISRRRDRGLHPGPLGSFDVHLGRDEQPPGSVIVGLGTIGDLTLGKLQQTIRTGLLALASGMDEDDRREAAGRNVRGVSCVLVGSGAGVLRITESVRAILQAVHEANQILGESRLDDVELIELVEQRAISAWHSVRSCLKSAELRNAIDLQGEVHRLRGTWRQFGPDDDPSWWMPITIRDTARQDEGSEELSAVPSSDRGALHFEVIAGRARVEASLVGTQRSVIDLYLDRIAQRRVETGSASAARTLFELLWPNRLKEQSLDDRNVRLILDEGAASLPWEMMDDRRPWVAERSGAVYVDRDPPAARFGVLRQLAGARFREATGPSSTALRRKALVIGDPRAADSPLDELPGAQAEAEQIATLLEKRGFEVTRLIGDRAMPEHVISALFADAWEVIHIAAHGVFKHRFDNDPAAEPRTGIVLGGVPRPFVIDCEMLEQLPTIPELVFVNCCSLGSIDASDERAHLLAHRSALASSIAVQLIRMGTKAVVAAGWEVGDEPAARFAMHLYEGLLAGVPFGNGCLDARKDVYHAFPSDSTWGAYQCYGTPDFRLRKIGFPQRHHDDSWVFAAPSEAISAIERIASLAEIGGERDTRSDLDTLRRVEEKVAAKGWLRYADVRSTLALAFSALGDIDRAIDHYAQAATAEPASLPVGAVEQMLNARVKRAHRRVDMQRNAAIAEIEKSIVSLEGLVDACGDNLERRSLIGSAYKRLAIKTRGDARKSALIKMVDAYALARESGKAAGLANLYYPWSQELAGRVVLSLVEGKGTTKGIAQLRRSIERPTPDDFWLRLLPVDLDLLEALGRKKLTSTTVDAIVQGYSSVWKDTGSKREMSSVFEQIEFYQEMLDDKLPGHGGLGEGLQQVKEQLEAATAN